MSKSIVRLLLLFTLIGTFLISGVSCSKHPAWNITAVAVSGDGKTIFTIASKYETNEVGVYKSIDGGSSFSLCTMPSGFIIPPRLVAVAPDDPNKLVVVDSTPAQIGQTEGGILWLSKTGGQNWDKLPAVPNISAVATTMVSDIDIGPKRLGAFLGRNYVICSRDSVTGVTGRVHTIGAGDIWEDLDLCFPVYPMDFTSCRISPNSDIDRCMVAVGSTEEDTFEDIVNINTKQSVVHVLLETSGIDSPGDTQIVTSDIALPSDFNPVSAAGPVSFIAWDSDPYTNDDVYRINGTAVTKLSLPENTTGIRSIVYSGTIDTGKLIAGMRANTTVYNTTDPASDSPGWSFASVPPAGERNVILSRDAGPASTGTFYAGTSGTGSGFFISTDSGNTFN